MISSITTTTSVQTYTATIYCGLQKGYGPDCYYFQHAEAICREYCDTAKLCVTVTPTTFVYVGGSEHGVAIGLINYPRFPLEPDQIRSHAVALAAQLRERLEQNRVSIVFPDRTVMIGSPDFKSS